jgi:hypothetical protein
MPSLPLEGALARTGPRRGQESQLAKYLMSVDDSPMYFVRTGARTDECGSALTAQPSADADIDVDVDVDVVEDQ